MVDARTSSGEPGIDQIWREAAHRASDAQLAIMAALLLPVAAGALVAAALRLGVLRWWPVLLVPLFFSAFGFWGIAERELRSTTPQRSRRAVLGWRAVLIGATGLAIGCGVVGVLLFLRVSIGTWIS